MNGPAPPNRGCVTINQMAEAAGISKASVSRYIGGDRQSLADATVRRIEHAIDQFGYRPSQIARGLKRGRTRLIGMLVADIPNPYSVAIIHDVETACHECSYSLVVCNTDRDDEQERHHPVTLQPYDAEGLIVNTLGHHPDEPRTLYRKLPIVPVDRQPTKLDTDLVGLDSADAAEQTLDYFQQRGLHDIPLVTEPLDGISSRIEWVRASNASIGRRPALKGQVPQTGDFFRDGLRAFLSASGPGSKVLPTCNGAATLCATHQLYDLGYRLFDEVGLLALGELDWYPLVGSGITALAQPTDKIGRIALGRLLARPEGNREPARRVTLPAQLIVRGSTHPHS